MSWWERCPISSGADPQVVDDLVVHVAKVTGKGDRKTHALACVFQLVFTLCSRVFCLQLCQIFLDVLTLAQVRDPIENPMFSMTWCVNNICVPPRTMRLGWTKRWMQGDELQPSWGTQRPVQLLLTGNTAMQRIVDHFMSVHA